MADTKRARFVMRKRVQPSGRHGMVYCWLRAHHPEVQELRSSNGPSWADLILDMTEDGAVTATGAPPSVQNVHNIWKRVCRDVAAQPPPQARPGATFPSRVSPDWRPQIVPQPSSPAAASSSALTVSPVVPPPPTPGRALKVFQPSYPGELVPQEEIDEMIAAVFDDLREHDRKTFGGFRRPRSQAALPQSAPNTDPERDPNA